MTTRRCWSACRSGERGRGLARRVDTMKRTSDSTATGRLRVVVIDDDPEILSYLSELLSADDCEVTTIANPSEGLERLRRRNELWHMLILDLEMPEMPGMRLLERLRQVDRELAVITLT